MTSRTIQFSPNNIATSKYQNDKKTFVGMFISQKKFTFSNSLMHFNSTSHGSVACNTLAAQYDQYTQTGLAFGGREGRGSPGCPSNYSSVGKSCIKIPFQLAASHDDMHKLCKENVGSESVPYVPRDQIQNAVFQRFVSHRNV